MKLIKTWVNLELIRKKKKQSNKLNNKNVIRINIGTHKKTHHTHRKSEPKHPHHVASYYTIKTCT